MIHRIPRATVLPRHVRRLQILPAKTVESGRVFLPMVSTRKAGFRMEVERLHRQSGRIRPKRPVPMSFRLRRVFWRIVTGRDVFVRGLPFNHLFIRGPTTSRQRASPGSSPGGWPHPGAVGESVAVDSIAAWPGRSTVRARPARQRGPWAGTNLRNLRILAGSPHQMVQLVPSAKAGGLQCGSLKWAVQGGQFFLLPERATVVESLVVPCLRAEVLSGGAFIDSHGFRHRTLRQDSGLRPGLGLRLGDRFAQARGVVSSVLDQNPSRAGRAATERGCLMVTAKDKATNPQVVVIAGAAYPTEFVDDIVDALCRFMAGLHAGAAGRRPIHWCLRAGSMDAQPGWIEGVLLRL
jgi:hypothetical protein